MTSPTHTKIIWTVTSTGIDKLGIAAVAHTIHHYNIDAMRMTYSQESKQKIFDLRQQLFKEFPSKNHQPAQGHVPFILNFINRCAIVCLPTPEKEVCDGEKLDIVFKVDPKFCTAHGGANTPISPELKICVTHRDQMQHLKPGSSIRFSYGAVTANVIKVSPGDSPDSLQVSCEIELGGLLLSGMDVSSPDMTSDLFPLLPENESSLADKDFVALADYVIVDGIKSDEELFYIKKLLIGENTRSSKRHPSVEINKTVLEKETQVPPRLLLKVDSKRAYELLSSLMPHIDGVFLSRSELGRDEHPHNLPILQKNLISLCNSMSKTIIVASELMHSMRVNSNPTRAEVSDMANAAADGADALVLSHEVTEGPNAQLVAAVSKETLINSEAWLEKKWRPFHMETIPSDDDAVTYGAMRIAEQANVKGIVCFTEGGYTAVKLSSMRTPIPIIAITCNKKIMRQLSLLRSVTCVLLDTKLQMEKILQNTKEILAQNFSYKKGDKFVFVSLTASSISARNSNIFTLQEID